MGGLALETTKPLETTKLLEPFNWSCHDNFDRAAD
jgi:hypothetical protein